MFFDDFGCVCGLEEGRYAPETGGLMLHDGRKGKDIGCRWVANKLGVDAKDVMVRKLMNQYVCLFVCFCVPIIAFFVMMLICVDVLLRPIVVFCDLWFRYLVMVRMIWECSSGQAGRFVPTMALGCVK